MSDRNPYYSIPVALGQASEEVQMLPMMSGEDARKELENFEEFSRNLSAKIREIFG